MQPNLLATVLLFITAVLGESIPNQWILRIATQKNVFSPEADLGTQITPIAAGYATRFNKHKPGIRVLGALEQGNYDLVLVQANVSAAALARPGVQVFPNTVVRPSATWGYSTWGHEVCYWLIDRL